MHIGLIGGIGLAATHTYYDVLVRAAAAAERPLELTIAHADLATMLDNIAADRREEQARVFADHVERLRAAGCAAVAVTSMGGRFCARELDAISPLPLIDALPALEAYFAAAGVRRIGVLGTRTVMDTRLYGLAGVEVIVPADDTIDAVGEAYVAIARSAAADAGVRAFFRHEGAKLHRDGAEIVVLGGTDLSVAFRGETPGYPIVDTAEVHAAAIARVALSDDGAVLQSSSSS